MNEEIAKDNYCSRIKKTIRDVIIQLENNEDSSFNLINRINSDIIAKLRYGFSVVTWKITMLNEIDKEIRKALKDLNIYTRQITQ